MNGDPNLLTAKSSPQLPMVLPTEVVLRDLVPFTGIRALTIYIHSAGRRGEDYEKQRRPHGASAFNLAGSTPMSQSVPFLRLFGPRSDQGRPYDGGGKRYNISSRGDQNWLKNEVNNVNI